MKHIKWIFPLAMIGLLSLAAIQTDHAKNHQLMFYLDKEDDYAAAWKKIDSLANKGLTKSALEIVEEIYEDAKKQNNAPQFVKAVIHKMKFYSYIEEDGLQNNINRLQEEVKTAQYPIKPVLHSMLAEIYWKYYQNNRWRFYNRTETANFDNEDINTWSLQQIVDQVDFHYGQSLKLEAKLKQTKLDIFDAVLTGETHDSRKFRPTLYDFLAHRAIDFYINEETGLAQPAYKFEIDKADYFQPLWDFIGYDITTKDTLSLKYKALLILQDVLAFHTEDEKPLALVDADLKRLKLVHNNSIHPAKDSLYLGALQKLEKEFISFPVSTEVAHEIAQHHRQNGSSYDPQKGELNKRQNKMAHDKCEEAIQRFPESLGAQNCRHLKALIEQKSISFQVERVNLPNQPFRALVNYKNLGKPGQQKSTVYIRVAALDHEEYRKDRRKYYGDDLIKHLLKISETKAESNTALTDEGLFNPHAAEIKIPAVDVGLYAIFLSTSPDFNLSNNAVTYAITSVSNIAYVSRSEPSGDRQFQVAHRKTGEPLAGVEAQLWQEYYDYDSREYEIKKGGSEKTDENGRFTVKGNRNSRSYYIEFIHGKDRLNTDNSFYSYSSDHRLRWNTRTHFFTDRSIYRPGQTVHFKGIMIESNGEENRILSGEKTTVTFYNANYEKVSSLEMQTNEYGTFSGSFTAPVGVMNGIMRISNNSGSTTFSVEEYKRPKFEVTFQPVKGTYKLGEQVKLTGLAKAYAGSYISDAEVKYRVVREAFFPYPWYFRSWWMPQGESMEIDNGTLQTNDKGEFEISFEAIPDRSIPKKFKPSFRYTIYADVTDINGETRSGETVLNIGYTALNMSIDIADKVNQKEVDEVEIKTTNPAGEFEAASGKLTIHQLKTPAHIFRDRKWSRPDQFTMTETEYHQLFPNDVYKDENKLANWEKGEQVLSVDFNTEKDKKIDLQKLKKQNQGAYVLEAVTRDKYGEEVKLVKYFTLFSPDKKELPYKQSDWFQALKSTAEPGEKAEFLIGSSYENVKVLYEIEEHDKSTGLNQIAHSEWLVLSSAQKKISIPVEEKHRGNFIVHFTFFKNNEVFKHDQVIQVPRTDKKLDIEFSTFRNKLKPGQKEEWKLKVKGKNGEKVAAEMVAALYDASLDAFKPHGWNFDIYNTYYARLSWSSDNMFSTSGSNTYSGDWSPAVPDQQYRNYDQLNWFGYYFYDGYARYRGRSMGAVQTMAAPMEDSEAADEAMALEEVAVRKESEVSAEQRAKDKKAAASGMADMDGAGGEQQQEAEKQVDLSQVQARTNFNETAFFYPHLETDAEGNVVISFTIPEALTKWKMLGFAHTKDLKFGLAENELITQKDLMVMPNPPRFFRENDEITFSAKISNLSDKKLDGQAQLFLFDALSMQPVDQRFGNKSAQKSFTVDKDGNTSVSWQLNIPEGISAVTYRVVAKAGNFSDGEEMALPVLTNRMLVTETMPLPVRGTDTARFEFDKLMNAGKSNTLRHHELTLEFTPNPAWYAIQALPYMMEYPYECSEQIFSRFYANSIAAHIANSDPQIKRVFEAWKRHAETNKESTLYSNLERNQELKSLLLEETPWVMDAKDESERKRRLAILFDLNRMSNELDRALKKLRKAQTPNGGWAWFPGMPDSWYITQHIVAGMGHLDRLGVKSVRDDRKTWDMTKSAILYTDERIRESYENLKKSDVDMSKNHLSHIHIHYLYARSFFRDIDIDKRNREAFDYFKGQAAKYWLDNNRYLQGMIALALHRYEDKSVPQDIVKSLNENALHHDELGMYWKDMMGGYYWYQAPIETQALMIELFDEVAQDDESVEALKVWLLKQKQTQNWKTTKATAEACYALLLRGTDLLSNNPQVDILLGNFRVYNYSPTRGNKQDERYIDGEAGTGYFKTKWDGDEIQPSMGNVKVKKSTGGVAWGAVYWQYFEQLDKITPAETPLSIKKQLFLEKQSNTGPVISPVKDGQELNVGDKIKVRIEIRVDRAMEYVHMKDMRAAGFEPINVLSQYKYQDGLGYYESTRDAATNFFFDYLPRGTYVFEYPLRVSHEGDFSNGITTIQSMYAPEFASHSEGVRVVVE